MEKCKIKNLYNLDETIAKELLESVTYPWEALPKIEEFIIELGNKLDSNIYEKRGENIWIAKSAKVAPTAYINGPAIIGENAEVRHCAFIRGKAIVGNGAVVGNSTELKNVILFNKVQVPHYNYVGDSILGFKAHMGAGSITSNVKSDKKLVVVKYEREQIETGLKKFGDKYPDKFFDVGIAEQHALTFAAGLAKEGMIPFVPIYSSFYQRAYDQVIHDVCMQNLHVIMCADRAGIVGNDGETHQGLLDMASFSIVPNMTIMAPKDFKELEQMIDFAVNFNGPILIRYPRGGEDKYKFNKEEKIELGKAETLTYGKNATIISIGKTVSKAVKIAEKLEKVEVINARFLKPLDVEKIKESIAKTKNVIVIEDGTSVGGLTTAIKELIVDENLKNIKFKSFAYPDKFIEHGSVEELEKRYNVDENAIKRYVELQIKEKGEE